MRTLVVIGTREFADRRFTHNEELEPNLLPAEVVDYWLDKKWLAETDSTERRSIYRIFHRFSGCGEKQPLPQQEVENYCL